MTIAKAFFAPSTGQNNSLIVLLSTRADACDKFAAGELMRSWAGLAFGVYEVTPDGQNPPAEPGAYTLVSSDDSAGNTGKAGLARYQATDANCTDALASSEQPLATSGTLTVESVSDSLVTGSFAATFFDSPLHGTFEATRCDAMVAPQASNRICEPKR